MMLGALGAANGVTVVSADAIPYTKSEGEVLAATLTVYKLPGDSAVPSSNAATRTPTDGEVQLAALSTRSSGLIERVLVVPPCIASRVYEVIAADDGVYEGGVQQASKYLFPAMAVTPVGSLGWPAVTTKAEVASPTPCALAAAIETE